MDPVGAHAKIVERDKRGVRHGSARVAQSSEAPWRGPERWVQQDDAPHAPETAGELDILHDGNVCKASHFVEDIGFDKDRLISEKRPGDCADAPQQSLPPYHPQMPVIESPVKRSADYPVIPGDRRQSFEMLNPQLGIRMVKAQEKPSRFLRTCVQLCPARRRVASDQTDFSLMFPAFSVFPWVDCGNYPFSSRLVRRGTAHEASDKIVIAPYLNDQAYQRTDHVGLKPVRCLATRAVKLPTWWQMGMEASDDIFGLCFTEGERAGCEPSGTRARTALQPSLRIKS